MVSFCQRVRRVAGVLQRVTDCLCLRPATDLTKLTHHRTRSWRKPNGHSFRSRASFSKFNAACVMSQLLFIFLFFRLLCLTSNNKGVVKAKAHTLTHSRGLNLVPVFLNVWSLRSGSTTRCVDFLWWSCSFFCRCDVYLTATRPGEEKRPVCLLVCMCVCVL